MTKPKENTVRRRFTNGRYRDQKQVIFRTTTQQVQLFKQAAAVKADGNLSKWIESVLLREARKVVG